MRAGRLYYRRVLRVRSLVRVRIHFYLCKRVQMTVQFRHPSTNPSENRDLDRLLNHVLGATIDIEMSPERLQPKL